MEATEQAKFKVGTKYFWDPTAEFIVTGAEFNILYNYLAELMKADSLINVSNILRIADCFGVSQMVLEREIVNGKIKEEE